MSKLISELVAVGGDVPEAEWKELEPRSFPPMPLPESRLRGPLVFLGYDQEELNTVYSQAPYARNQTQVQSRQCIHSEQVRRRLGRPLRVAYGSGSMEKLDIYSASQEGSPTVVFIHGGAWREGLAQDFAFPAEMFVRSRVNYVVPDFNNVLETGGDLTPMAVQVRSAIAWTISNAPSFGGDPSQVYVIGHSAGAHLAGAVLASDWGDNGLLGPGLGMRQDAVRGALLACGMYDLKGPRLSSRSEYVRFTDAVEQELSAQRNLNRLQVPLILAYGTLETPEFQRQTWDFAQSLRSAGKHVQLIRAEGYNHFEILETLANPFGTLGRAALAMVGMECKDVRNMPRL